MPATTAFRCLRNMLAALSMAACPLLYAQDTDPALTRELVAGVMKQDAWMAELKQCPAQLVPVVQVFPTFSSEGCKTPSSACLARCEHGDAGACYWLGQGLQARKAPDPAFEALYLRACKMGVMSGCTNRAAGMTLEKPDDNATLTCASQTFDKACQFDDPWACTMQAFHLSRGIGVAPDVARALRLLDKSCKYGANDPACAAGMKLRKEIGDAKAAAKK